jgi:diguanylate cyclase (GGDEF)-like protein
VLKKRGLGAQLRKLPRGPDLAELHQLLSQCMEQRGKVVKLAWRGANLTPFTLEVVCHLKHGTAQWRLFTEHKDVPLFDYTSVDVLLVYNLVASHCAEVQQQGSRETSQSHQKLPAFTPPAPEHVPSPVAQTKKDPEPYLPEPPKIKRQEAEPEPPSDFSYRNTHQIAGQDTTRPPLIVKPVTPTSEFSSPKPSKPERIQPPGQNSQPEQAPPVSHANQTPAFAPVPPRPSLSASGGVIPREGELREGELPTLLHEIARAGVTGRLDVRYNDMNAIVFIQDGKPVDATANDVVGDEAMIEILTWKEGTFAFESRILRNNHTVYESIDSLVAQSRKLKERIEYLKEAGMVPSSALTQINTLLSQSDFIAKVQEHCPSDLDTISRVYCALDGQRTFEELCRFLHISRIQMLHIVFHLITRELVKIVNDVPPKSELTLAPRVIDNSAIQSIMMSLRRAETGLFIYPAFLYFLEQEYFRSYRSRSSFSVVVFEIRQKKIIDGQIVRRVLNEKAQMDAVLRINGIKRHMDLMAHYDGNDYALLLPNTRTQGAEIFIGRIIDALRAKPLGGEIDASQLSIAFGSSSVPDDFKDMSTLLGAADLAMARARDTDTPLIMYRDIKNLVG